METFAVITTWNEFLIFSHFSMASALFLTHLNDQLCPAFSILESFLIPCMELSLDSAHWHEWGSGEV